MSDKVLQSENKTALSKCSKKIPHDLLLVYLKITHSILLVFLKILLLKYNTWALNLIQFSIKYETMEQLYQDTAFPQNVWKCKVPFRMRGIKINNYLQKIII